MNALAQVWHVTKKDALEYRRPLIIYAIVVSVATQHAIGWLAPGSDIYDSMMLIIVLFGMLLAASFVQTDSPSRADAFWATRPLSPSAVIGAKIALAALALVGLGALGQLAALVAHDVPARTIPMMLLESVWYYGRWLLMAMVIAAITRDLRSFLVVVIAVPVATPILLGLFVPAVRTDIAVAVQLPTAVRITLDAIGLVSAPLALIYLYRTRDARAKVWAASGVAVLMTILSFAPGASDSAPPPADAPPSLPRVSLTVDLPDSANVTNHAQLDIRLVTSPAPSNERLTLGNAVAVVDLLDGGTLRIPIENQTIELGSSAPPLDGTSWVGGDPTQQRPIQISVGMSNEQRRAIAGGVKRVAVEGRVVVREARMAGTIPLAVGAVYSKARKQIRIMKLSTGFGSVSMVLAMRTLLDADGQARSGLLGTAGIEYVLLNENSHQAVALFRVGTSGHAAWLVLPSTSMQAESATLESKSWGGGSGSREAVKLPDSWFQSARLGVIAWETRGSYPVRAEVAVP